MVLHEFIDLFNQSKREMDVTGVTVRRKKKKMENKLYVRESDRENDRISFVYDQCTTDHFKINCYGIELRWGSNRRSFRILYSDIVEMVKTRDIRQLLLFLFIVCMAGVYLLFIICIFSYSVYSITIAVASASVVFYFIIIIIAYATELCIET